MTRPLHEIADEIRKDWTDKKTGASKVYFGAVPYLEAMLHLDTMDDRYGEDAAVNIVIYFLSNAKTWRGDVAKRVKDELRKMLVN